MVKILEKNRLLIFILILGFFLRLISFHFYQDQSLENEWGILFKNYINFDIIGINISDGKNIIEGVAIEGYKVFPSVYMPPFYLYFIIFFSHVFAEEYLVTSVLFFQIFLSLINSYYIYRLLNTFYNKKISLIGLSIFIFFPLNIYCTSQISSITFQIFFITLFLYFLIKIIEKQKIKNIIYFSVCSAFLILLRGEFILILLFSYIFLIFKTNKLKFIIISIPIILILISPYVIRNYIIFQKVIITKSLGFNLWKGNNLYSRSEGNVILYDSKMIQDLNQIKPDKYFELKKDDIYKKYALKNLKSEPSHYLKLYVKKILAFVFFDIESTYPNYYSVFHILPKVLIGVISLIGFFIIGFKKNNLIYFNLCFLINILVFSAFFILPRYQLGILPLQIILCCAFFEKFFLKFRNISQ